MYSPRRGLSPDDAFRMLAPDDRRRIEELASGSSGLARERLGLPRLAREPIHGELTARLARMMAYHWLSLGYGTDGSPTVAELADRLLRGLLPGGLAASHLVEDVVLAQAIAAREGPSALGFDRRYGAMIDDLVDGLGDPRARTDFHMEGLVSYLVVEVPHRFRGYEGTAPLRASAYPSQVPTDERLAINCRMPTRS
jgi:hypothetical protein